MNTPNTTNTTVTYTSKDIASAVHCPGSKVGGIVTKAGVQPLHVRVSKTGMHYYIWGQDAMDVALAWRVEQDARLLHKKDQRSRIKIEKEAKKSAPKQLELQLPQPDVTETFPTIERRKDDAQLIAIHEQLITLNNTMAALLAIWTKE